MNDPSLQGTGQRHDNNGGPNWFMILFFILPILIPIIKHSIRHRWIFAILGLIAGGVVHVLFEETLRGNDFIIGLIYVVFISLGIYVTTLVRKRDKARGYRHGTPTNPSAPEELYDD
ncbi:MAG: hypothetical protein FWC97_01585 [Treponema sp.]|nr:hypothetical protein [Treponema sp.]